MRFSDNAMSAILLCSYIGIKHDDTVKPLSLKEWNELLDRTAQYGQQPSIVMKQDQTFLREAGYGQEYEERIKKLVFRGGTVAFELDDLERKGIEVITPYDQDYPILLKRRLKKKTPPVLFYAGDITLAKKIGIGVVGSRNVDENGIRFTQALVEKAASERLIVYSGGAKGVDTISERAAIESGSGAVSFVADSLLSKIRKKDLIDSIISKQRLLISDVKPDVGFTAARAMSRNKYIYASSYGTFVVASDYNKGGTWAGATEAMRNGWTKVLVWNGGGYEGNKKLIEKGAVSYGLSEASVYDMITRKEESFQQIDMFSFAQDGGERQEASSQQKELSKQPEVWEKGEGEMALPQKGAPLPEERGAKQEQAAANGQIDLYDVAGPYIMAYIGDGMTRDEAAEVFQVAKKQMETWLRRLCQESRLKCVKGRYVRCENT